MPDQIWPVVGAFSDAGRQIQESRDFVTRDSAVTPHCHGGCHAEYDLNTTVTPCHTLVIPFFLVEKGVTGKYENNGVSRHG